MVYTYFKNAPFNSGDFNNQDMKSLFAFQEKIEELGHFKTYYENIHDLKYQFSMQLDKVLPNM